MMIIIIMMIMMTVVLLAKKWKKIGIQLSIFKFSTIKRYDGFGKNTRCIR